MSGGEVRDGVSLTNLDQLLFDGAEATKRDLVDYLDAVAGRIIPELRGRPLSVVRVLRGQAPFMQKNVPRYTPPWVRTVTLWTESSRREVSYALCDGRRTLLLADYDLATQPGTALCTSFKGTPSACQAVLSRPRSCSGQAHVGNCVGRFERCRAVGG